MPTKSGSEAEEEEEEDDDDSSVSSGVNEDVLSELESASEPEPSPVKVSLLYGLF